LIGFLEEITLEIGSNNYIGDVGAQTLAVILKDYQTLKDLYFII